MEVNQILQKSHVTPQQLAQIIEKLNAASQAVLQLPRQCCRSLVLQVSTRRPTESPEEQQSELQGSSITISASSTRTFLMAREIGTLEWQSSPSPPGNYGH